MSALRPLPPRPSLEYEHKEAKALLRRLRAGDPEALTRARKRHPQLVEAQARLADAQLVIAREYGFTSWPRLVRYFGEVKRQDYVMTMGRRDFYDAMVRSVLVEHRDRRAWTAFSLASYVPRFYGLPIEEVFASTVTEDEARLTVARQQGFPSWDVMLEETAKELRGAAPDWDEPRQKARKALEDADLAGLQRVVQAHPDLLQPTYFAVRKGPNLLSNALYFEQKNGIAWMRPIVEWLETQGLSLRDELGRQLSTRPVRVTVEVVRALLDRGADPNWVAPNGYSVLEHAIVRYWNPEAVDFLASRVKRPDALWVAAGLGDVPSVGRFLDADGKPTAAARRRRPNFAALGMPMPQLPDPSDEDVLLEAFHVALFNQRTNVLEYLVSRGFPLNSTRWDSPPIHMAVGNGFVSVAECLIRCGADLDLRGWRPHMSARELARSHFEGNPQDTNARRIVELCGLDPEKILAEYNARPAPEPSIVPGLKEIIELAGDDAYRLGFSEIGPVNLLFGLVRHGGTVSTLFPNASRADVERFRADFADRVLPIADVAHRPRLPLSPESQALLKVAIDKAKEHRREAVNVFHFLHALTQSAEGSVAQLLVRYGGDVRVVNKNLQQHLHH